MPDRLKFVAGFMPRSDGDSICIACFLTMRPTSGKTLQQIQEEHDCYGINLDPVERPDTLNRSNH